MQYALFTLSLEAATLRAAPLTALRPPALPPVPRRPQIMAYYLLTVLEQDDGVEVQRLVKDLVRSRVSLRSVFVLFFPLGGGGGYGVGSVRSIV